MGGMEMEMWIGKRTTKQKESWNASNVGIIKKFIEEEDAFPI